MKKGTQVTYDGEQWTVRDSKEIKYQSGDSDHWLKLSQNEPPTRIVQTYARNLK